MINSKLSYLVSKLQIISNVLSIKRYATIVIISGLGLGIIYYFFNNVIIAYSF